MKDSLWEELLGVGLRALGPEGELRNEAPPAGSLGVVRDLFVFDLEMSGPNPLVHELLDVGGVRASLAPGLPEVTSVGARVKPKRIGNADPSALRVVGYSAKAWRDGVELPDALERFLEVGRSCVLAGWGVSQDMSFLSQNLRSLGPWPFASFVLDIQPLAKKVLGGRGGEVDRYNLGHVADRLGIGRMGEHGALADAYAAYDVLVKLLDRLNGPAQPGQLDND